MTGAGFAPAGVSPAGIGYVAPVSRDRSRALTDATGRRHGSRYIDPKTKQYEVDENGRYRGMPNVAHLVQLAFLTPRGSSALPNLGLAPPSGVLSNGFVPERQAAVRDALAPYVASGLIEIVTIDVDTKRRPAVTLVRWRDLSTLEEEETFV